MGGPPEPAIALVKEMRRQGMTARLVGGTTIMDVNLPERTGPDGQRHAHQLHPFLQFRDPLGEGVQRQVRRGACGGRNG